MESSALGLSRDSPSVASTNQHALIEIPCNQPAMHHCSPTRTASLHNSLYQDISRRYCIFVASTCALQYVHVNEV